MERKSAAGCAHEDGSTPASQSRFGPVQFAALLNLAPFPIFFWAAGSTYPIGLINPYYQPSAVPTYGLRRASLTPASRADASLKRNCRNGPPGHDSLMTSDFLIAMGMSFPFH